jgi:type I restriction enzyme, S subunit
MNREARVIDGLKPYAGYVDSGQDWLGSVPAHWGQLRAKRLFREVDERSTTGKEELLSVSHLTGVTPRRFKTVTMFLAESNVGHKVCRPGDLVINTLWAWMGALGVTRHTGIVSPAYGVYRSNAGSGILPAYADHLLRTPLYAAEYQRRSTGVNSSRLRLYPEQFLRIPVLMPPPAEQEGIVRFLNWANGRLERTIRAKRKVIALLMEQKQAIIHSAVTQGLDPAVPLKPSGVAWIGSIPKHWEVLSLKRVLRRLIDCEHKTAPLVDQSPYRVVRTTAVRQGSLRIRGTYCTSSVAFGAWTRRGMPEPGDVIFTREAPSGEACIIPQGLSVCLGQRTVLMKPNKQRLRSEFLVHSIYAGPPRVSITLATQGSTVGHFNMSDIGALMILLPPRMEQEAIVAAIVERTAELERTIARFEREIELLREYRTRVVVDVVTGKLDVRDAAAHLPEEATPEIAEELIDEADDTALANEEEPA